MSVGCFVDTLPYNLQTIFHLYPYWIKKHLLILLPMSTESKIHVQTAVLVLFVLLAGVLRLIPSFSQNSLINFTPIGAMALFGGSRFADRRKAYLIPILTLWLTDLILNRFLYFHHWVFFYDGFLWVYGTFALIVTIGMYMIRKATVVNVVLAAITASLLHWLVTDFGVWLGGGQNPATGLPYPKTLEGYQTCLIMALPFLKNFLTGTLVYSGILFGSYAWLQHTLMSKLEISK